MKKSNSIVRTKTIYGSDKKPNEMHFEIDFMTFSKYIFKKDGFTVRDIKFDLYPYKWYDLRWIYQIPSYWFLVRILRKSESNISRKTHKRISIITLIIEILITTRLIIELIF